VSKFALNFDPTTILITLADGRSFNAERKGEDVSRQIALVKIDASDLPVPELLPPAAVQVGQWAFVLGRTFSAGDPSVHMGVVSATQRIFGRAIQIDAYTSPANYGGPVVDIEGRVMGIAVPMDSSGRKANVGLYDSGIGFAATLADIAGLIKRMQDGEVLHRGFLGVATDPAFIGPGAKLTTVDKKSVAYRAKIRKGHIVTEIDGTKITNSFHLQMLVGNKMAGDPVHLKVRKPGKENEEFGTTVFLEKVSTAGMEATDEAEADKGVPLPWEDPEKDKKK
jgi:serine protease Do